MWKLLVLLPMKKLLHVVELDHAGQAESAFESDVDKCKKS